MVLIRAVCGWCDKQPRFHIILGCIRQVCSEEGEDKAVWFACVAFLQKFNMRTAAGGVSQTNLQELGRCEALPAYAQAASQIFAMDWR